jgi:hypothetical protein
VFNNKFTICVPCIEDEETQCPVCASEHEAANKKSLRYIGNVFLLELTIDKDGQRVPCDLRGEPFSADDWKFEDRIKLLIEGGETDGKLLWNYDDDGGTLLNRVYVYRRYKAERVKYDLIRGDRLEDENIKNAVTQAQEKKYNILKFLYDRRAKGLKDWNEWVGGGASTTQGGSETKVPLLGRKFSDEGGDKEHKEFRDFNIKL